MKNVQFFLLPEESAHRSTNTDGCIYLPGKKGTYLELESNFTDPLTSCKVCLEPEGAALLPPDAAAYDNPTVLSRVPIARYSVLMARPRIVLE